MDHIRKAKLERHDISSGLQIIHHFNEENILCSEKLVGKKKVFQHASFFRQCPCQKRDSYNQECLIDCFKKLSAKFNPNTSGRLIQGMTNNMKYFSKKQFLFLLSSVALFSATFFVSFFPFFFNLLVSFFLLRSLVFVLFFRYFLF